MISFENVFLENYNMEELFNYLSKQLVGHIKPNFAQMFTLNTRFYFNVKKNVCYNYKIYIYKIQDLKNRSILPSELSIFAYHLKPED